jgi:hypothetical protein
MPNGCSSDSSSVGQLILPWIDLSISGRRLLERERGGTLEKGDDVREKRKGLGSYREIIKGGY